MIAAVWALLAATLFREITGSQAVAEIGTFDLSIADPAFILACLAALRCWLAKPLNVNAATVPALVLAVLVCVSLARGVERNVFMAFFWLRTAGFLVPILIIGATLRPSAAFFARVRTAIVATGMILVLLVLLRTAFGTSLFFTIDFNNPADINDGDRAIGNSGAIVLAMAAVFTTGAILRPVKAISLPAVLLPVPLLLGLLLSMQVTAIVAALAALLVLIVVERPFRDRSIIGLAIGGFATALYLSYTSWLDLLPPTLRTAMLHRGDNIGTRQAIWDGFAARYQALSQADRLLGLPAGGDPALIVLVSGHWQPWHFSLHSMYVGVMEAFGLFGFCAYIAILLAATAISSLLAREGDGIGGFTPAVSLAFLALAAIEGYSYDLQQERLLLILVPMLLVAQARWSGLDAVPRPDHPPAVPSGA